VIPSAASRTRAVASGVLAYGLALAVGELVGGWLTRAGAPLVAVGQAAIDNAPEGPRKFAIDVFGTADKPALVWGIAGVTVVLGGLAGLVGRRWRVVPFAGLILLAAIGALATATETSAGAVAIVPSALGAFAGAACLWVLLSIDTSTDEIAYRSDAGAASTSRRAFLIAAGATAAVGVAAVAFGRELASRASATASRAMTSLRPVRAPLPAPPAGVNLAVGGITPFITPNADFYRIDTNLIAPQVATDGYELTVTGMVNDQRTFTYDELAGRAVEEFDITLTCVSNEVGGRLAGNARWQGFLLRDLLDEVGVQDGATQIVGRSVDGWTCGYPIEAAYDRNAIIAVGMNGEPLPIEHGFPVRLVTPGIYGFLSACKWLTEIELATYDFDPYWVKRGWGEKAPIQTFSRIDVPKGLARVNAGQVAVGGVAWAQTRGIHKVEVQVDDGPWQEAVLADELNLDTWRQWMFAWDAQPGNHRLQVRATDGTNEAQTDRRDPPIPTGATGWHAIQVVII
jgi:DMSO/TMAO reductase YedYZ molybdopterin-dependent catalytic subunit